MAKAKIGALSETVCSGDRQHKTDATALFSGVVRSVDPNNPVLWPPPGFELVITDYEDLKTVNRPPD